MSERREITRRLDTLGDVAEIMGALKNAAMVEAIRLRRYVPAQQRVMRTVDAATQDFLTHYPQLPYASAQAGEIFLVIGSERGFCGSYNQELAAALERARASGGTAECYGRCGGTSARVAAVSAREPRRSGRSAECSR